MDDGADLDVVGAIREIVLPLMDPKLKLNITIIIIQLLNLKALFGGLLGEYPNMHLVNFINIGKSFYYLRVRKNAIRLRLFLLFLSREQNLRLTKLVSFRRKVHCSFQEVTIEG